MYFPKGYNLNDGSKVEKILHRQIISDDFLIDNYESHIYAVSLSDKVSAIYDYLGYGEYEIGSRVLVETQYGFAYGKIVSEKVMSDYTEGPLKRIICNINNN